MSRHSDLGTSGYCIGCLSCAYPCSLAITSIIFEAVPCDADEPKYHGGQNDYQNNSELRRLKKIFNFITLTIKNATRQRVRGFSRCTHSLSQRAETMVIMGFRPGVLIRDASSSFSTTAAKMITKIILEIILFAIFTKLRGSGNLKTKQNRKKTHTHTHNTFHLDLLLMS